MTLLLCFFAFLLIYPLVIYPFCLMFLQRLKEKNSAHVPPTPSYLAHEICPSISILLSVFNEESIIKEKIENFLALDYPKDKLELLIVSDQSTDATDAIITEYMEKPENHGRIQFLRQEIRAGKTKALNCAALAARNEILFFTDADSMLHEDALYRIAAPFSHTRVGLVSGRSIYRAEDGTESTGSAYRRYEEWLKEYEGKLYGIAGADGAIYAMRKELYQELPENIINDLVHPIQVILKDHAALAEPNALVSEPAEDDGNAFARQTRIMAQSWHVFFTYLRPLIQEKRWGFLWQFCTHKILRWLALVWLSLFTVTAFFAQGILGNVGLAGVIALLLCAALGERAKILGRICRLFLMQSAAGIYGLIRLWQGNTFVTWNPKGN